MRNGLIAAMLLFAIGSPAAAQDGWTPGGSSDGVALSFRDDAASGTREVRAIAEVPHAADRVIAVACDFTQELDPDVREVKLLSGDLDSRYSIYLRYAPRYVVVAARDVVIDVRRQADGCAWSEAANGAELREGTVRMPLLRGSWTVEPLDTSRSRVTYQIAVNPGGRIPKWMVRRGAAGALPRVIERINRCLAESTADNVRCAAK